MDEPASSDSRAKGRGLTMVLDRLSGLIEEEFQEVAQFVDIVEIGWGLPMVWSEDAVVSRMKFYQRLGIRVSMSGTLLEYFHYQDDSKSILDRAARMGFDLVEVSDGIVDMTSKEKEGLTKAVKERNLGCLIAVGKKDPRNQLSLAEMTSQIENALSLEPVKVILEGRERGREVGIYDERGEVKWSMLRTITSRFGIKDLLFEAPLESQQGALISELGPEVNLGNVALSSIAALQSERLGLRFDTFRVSGVREIPAGGPALKFVLYAVRQQQPIDLQGIMATTQLPKRTVQKALADLLKQKLVTEHPSFEDARRSIYRTPTGSPLEQPR